MTAAAGDLTMTATLETIVAQVEALRDLFNRRLLEDKEKKRLYEELYDQTGFIRQDLAHQFLAPLLRELLTMVDRLERTGSDDVVVRSVLDELDEIVQRYGVRPIDRGLDRFDPRLHDAVESVPSTPERPSGAIIEVVRGGHLLGDRVLRPARVVVAGRAPAAPADQTSADAERSHR